ncbi:MAG: hypothetical protein IPO21_14190 [Bacteroidales bacterium]|nr:hypothetical protein [Bacteroidales bacterium]
MRNLSAILFSIIAIILALASCSKEPEVIIENYSDSLSGYIFKGPFQKGAKVCLQVLNDNLVPVGKPECLIVENDLSHFKFVDINASSTYVLLTASGNFFNEYSNTISDDTLSLRALVDLKDHSKVTISLVTDMLYARTLTYVRKNYTPSQAHKKAVAELCALYGYNSEATDFYDIDFMNYYYQNELLVAASFFVVNKASNTAVVKSNFNALLKDFEDNGKVDDKDRITSFKTNLDTNELASFILNLKNYYADKGQPFYEPELKSVLGAFLSINSLYEFEKTLIEYPIKAKFFNLLSDTLLQINADSYSIAVNLPADNSIQIIFEIDTGDFALTSDVNGWLVSDKTANGFTLTTQRENLLLDQHIILKNSGKGSFYVFENNAVIPRRIVIEWGLKK